LYKKVGGKIIKGLVKRRNAGKKIFLTGASILPSSSPPEYESKEDVISNIRIAVFTFYMVTILEKAKNN